MTQETTEVDEEYLFRIHCPSGIILEISAEDMPNGWQVWTCETKEIAYTASLSLGLPVTVERKQICTSRPKE